jgi:hypothetical protein
MLTANFHFTRSTTYKDTGACRPHTMVVEFKQQKEDYSNLSLFLSPAEARTLGRWLLDHAEPNETTENEVDALGEEF